VGDSSTVEPRTLTPLILVRIQVPQPRSPVSGVLFPGGGESPTFPQVRLGCPSLWSAISGISVRVGRVSGAGLWWRFFNFRFGGAETGSIADRERFAGRPSTLAAAPFGRIGAGACISGVLPLIISDIRADPTKFYVDVSTTTFPAGAIRGQLQ
jgi:hypothetical protein